MSRPSPFLIAGASLLITAMTSCSPRQPSMAPSPRPPVPSSLVDPWVITTTSLMGDYRPTYLGNGELDQVMDAGGLGMTGGTAAGAAQPAAAFGAAQHLLPGPQP